MVQEKSVRPVRKGARERYERILTAARDIIFHQGALSPLTINQLAVRSGVSRVSIYYFFDSADQVLQVLYDRAVEHMQKSLTSVVTATTDGWKKAIEDLLAQVIRHYGNNRVDMILSLTPVSFTEINQQNRTFSAALHRQLVAQSLWRDGPEKLRDCEVAVEIADAVMRKSFIEFGRITTEFQKEALIAFISYIEATSSHRSALKIQKTEVI
jgi:AcrR family transcriptional regulator